MLTADATHKIRVKLAGAITTNELPITGFWAQTAITGALEDVQNIHLVTTGTTPVDIVSVATASKVKTLKGLCIVNKDTAVATVTIESYDTGASSLRESWKTTLSIGDVLVYDGEGGFNQYDSSGNLKTTVAGAPTTAQYLTLATDGTLTAERVLTMGKAIGGTDAGAGSTYTLAVTVEDSELILAAQIFS